MSKSTPVTHKTCQGCQDVKSVNVFPRVGRGYGARCYPCLGMATPGPGEKTCTECKEAKPLSGFASKGRGRGPQGKCKECVSGIRRDEYHREPERHRARRRDHYWRNPEASRAASAKWKAENPQDPEIVNQHRRVKYRENPHKYYEQSSKWRVANPDRWREINRVGAARRRAANPEPVRAVGRRAISRRRARLRELPSEPYTEEMILERDGTDCVLCSEPLDLSASYPAKLAPTVEHLECLEWPNSAGDVLSNVAMSHWGCNNKRRNRPHPAAARKRAELLAAEQEMTA